MSAHHDPDRSDRVTVAEVNDFLAESLRMTRAGTPASLNELLDYHQRKADLLARIAAEQDTPGAHATAAKAQEQLDELRAKATHGADRDDEEAGDA